MSLIAQCGLTNSMLQPIYQLTKTGKYEVDNLTNKLNYMFATKKSENTTTFLAISFFEIASLVVNTIRKVSSTVKMILQ